MQQKYEQLSTDIVSISTEYAEKILINIHQAMDLIENFALNNSKNSKEFKEYVERQMNDCRNTILDLIYECLEKVYNLVSHFLKENYSGILLELIDVKSLIWNKDGLTLEERISKHILNSVHNLLELYTDGVMSYDNVQTLLDYEMIKIIDTETFVILNAVLYEKLKKHAKYFEVIGGAGCCDVCDSHQDIRPIEELDELPPYHPNCTCLIIYYLENPQ